MTIDEAIKHCLEVAEEQERKAQCMGRQFVGTAIANFQNDCFECAADHRQLAEWLTELKELRNSVVSDMKEALELIRAYKAENATLREQISEYKQLDEQIKELEAKHWDECRQIAHYDDELKEAKRLLKLAVEDLAKIPCNNDVYIPSSCNACIKQGNCDYSDSFKWRYTDEALKLIGGSENG